MVCSKFYLVTCGYAVLIFFGDQDLRIKAPQRLLLSAELSVSDNFYELEIILLRASSLYSISILYFFT